ncbi:MAG: cytochrome o ubiquinol oxidase subunit IV [Steroidobacteraceae bacterium]|jgi:cytochrome o ubiquinol oxidase operon protein cyoD
MSNPLREHHATGESSAAASHGSLRSYLTGFILSVFLTAIPFWLVMSGVLDSKIATEVAITTFAIVQITVHMVYFLHMNTRSEDGWSIMALMFTLILVVIALVGSLWIIYHLNANMMPGGDMSQMP